MNKSRTSVLAVTTGNTTCSPVTEVYNASTDRVFLSVQSLGSTSIAVNCPSNSGRLMSFSVPTTTGGSLPNLGDNLSRWRRHGVILDNTVAPGTLQTSQVNYSTLPAGTAVQAPQAALH